MYDRRPRAERRRTGGSSGPLGSLAWLLASLTSAAIAHGAIAWAGDHLSWLGADAAAYDGHEHATVLPVGLSAGIAIVAFVLARGAATIARHTPGSDATGVLARRFGSMNPLWPIALVAGGAVAVLAGMESIEQLQAFGHVAGLGEAFGGSVALGVSLVTAVAAAVTSAGLRSARYLLQAVESVALGIAAWIAIVAVWPSECGRPSDARTRYPRHDVIAESGELSRRSGLRAPPLRAIA